MELKSNINPSTNEKFDSKISFPREKNNVVDNGYALNANCACPKCGSLEYVETISTEECFKCDYLMDYWYSEHNILGK